MKKSNIILIIVLVISAFIFITSRLGSANFLVVLSESMRPTINMGDLVVTASTNPNDIKTGDIVAFKDGDKDFPITHRVVNITDNGFITKGDANEDPDPMVRTSNAVVGKVTFWVPFAGYFVYFARGPYGFIILIIIPGVILIVNEIRKVLGYVKESKERKTKTKKLYSSIILILLFTLLISITSITLSSSIYPSGAFFSDVEAGKGYFNAWVEEAPPVTVSKWWSDTNFVPMSDPMYNNIFYIVTKPKTGEITSTNPGGFFINIDVGNVPTTSSLTIVDTISGEISPTGDFVEWPSGLHVLLDGNEITKKFDYTFDNKTLTITLKLGESIPGGNLYAWFHVKYALIGTVADPLNYPRPYTNVVSITIEGNTYSSLPVVLTGQLKVEEIKEETIEQTEMPLLGGGSAVSTSQENNEEIDTTPPQYSNVSINGTQTDSWISHDVFWIDDKGLSGYIFSFDNCLGEFVNDTWMPFNESWSNLTKLINSTVNCTINWMVYANDTSNNWNVTDLFSYNTTEIIPEENTTENETENINRYYYNYSDSTNNKIKYSYNESLEEYPLASLDPDYGQEANSSQYLATLAYEGTCDSNNCFEYIFENNGTNKTVWHSFVFKINENISDIKSINISWAGYAESSVDGKLRILTNESYEDISSISTENQIYNYSITSNFENYLNSTNHLRFQVWALSPSESLRVWTDWVSVSVIV